MKRDCIFIAALYLFVLSLAHVTSAQDAKVAGSWDLSAPGRDGNMVTQTLTLQQDGTKLTGTMKGQRGDAPVTGTVSALFIDGVLVPNTEFGHIEIRGKDAEKRASEHAREEVELSWGKWASRLDEYLLHVEALLSPDLIIIGGGISKKSDKFLPRLTGLRARVVPAGMLNNAGIVGAAMAGG
jgi:hypothetical protein